MSLLIPLHQCLLHQSFDRQAPTSWRLTVYSGSLRSADCWRGGLLTNTCHVTTAAGCDAVDALTARDAV